MLVKKRVCYKTDSLCNIFWIFRLRKMTEQGETKKGCALNQAHPKVYVASYGCGVGLSEWIADCEMESEPVPELGYVVVAGFARVVRSMECYAEVEAED